MRTYEVIVVETDGSRRRWMIKADSLSVTVHGDLLLKTTWGRVVAAFVAGSWLFAVEDGKVRR